MSLDNIAFALGGLTATGGVIGFVRTSSVPSIVAGLSVGALYGLGGTRIRNRAPYGVELALLASVILAGSSMPRAIRTQKAVPVLLSLVSAYGLYNFGLAWQGRAR